MRKLLLIASAVILVGCGSTRNAVVPQVVNNYTHYADTTLNNYYSDTIINRINYVNDTIHETTTHIIHDNHFSATTQHDTITVYKTNTVIQTKTVTDKKWRRRFWLTISGLLTAFIMFVLKKFYKPINLIKL